MTDKEFDALIKVCRAVADAIRELGSVPSGHLYASLMGQMTLDTYYQILAALKDAGLVKEENHLLTYIGAK
jgi:hypothetical protein